MTQPSDSPSQEVAVTVVGDGAVAGPIAGGTLIPVILIDTTGRNDITLAMKAHIRYDEGDYRFYWGRAKRGLIGLHLNFTRPVETQVELFFHPARQAGLIDLMVQSQAFYIREARVGDNMLSSDGNLQLLLSLPHTGFEADWEDIYLESLTKWFRKHRRISRRAAKKIAKESINENRKMGQMRIPRKFD